MKHNGYAAQVEFNDEDEIFVGRLAGINDIISFHADTVSDLKAAFHEAVADYIATYAKAGKKPEKAYSGQIMVRVDPIVHARAALAAELAGKSLAGWTEESCGTRRRGRSRRSPKPPRRAPWRRGRS